MQCALIRNSIGSLLPFHCLTFVLLSPLLADEHRSSAKVVAAVRPFVDRHELAGAVALVATADKVVSIDAVGFADVDAQKPMATDSIFWIASQSKPITAAAVMTLVDDGKLKLDDPVEKYLPEFRQLKVVAERSDDRLVLVKPMRPITLRDVLSHCSGMPFKSSLEEPTLDRFSLEARVRSYAMTPLDTQPGTRYQYSNAGINTAARVVEVVSGMPFENFLDERILKPLAMNDTSFWPTEAQVDRIAAAYKPGAESKGLVKTNIEQLHYPLSDRQERFPMPAGGLFSTATDVAHFYQMLLSGGEFEGKRVLSETAVAELTRRQTPPEVNDSYGLGFSVSPDTFGHGGAYSTNSFANRKTGTIFVWLVQHAGFPGEGGKAQGAFHEAAK